MGGRIELLGHYYKYEVFRKHVILNNIISLIILRILFLDLKIWYICLFFFFLSFHSFHTTLIRKCSGLIFKPVIRILYISQIAISPFSFLQTSISYIPKQWNKLGSLPYGRILLYILLSVTVLEFYCLVIVVVFFQTQLLLWAIACMRTHEV